MLDGSCLAFRLACKCAMAQLDFGAESDGKTDRNGLN